VGITVRVSQANIEMVLSVEKEGGTLGKRQMAKGACLLSLDW